jgi:ABC-type branched-subunit amino acid transport system ATPase component/branched-subunit amino acid ABC-type transport system permease component
MTEIFQFALLGLGAGAIYALLAQGMVVIYKGTGIVNFAQGAFAMVGAYLFFELKVQHGWGTAAAFVASVLIVGLLGVLTHLLIMRQLRSASTLAKIVATLGLLAVLQGAAALRYGANLTEVPGFLPSGPVQIAGVRVGEDRLWLLGIAVVLTAILFVVGRYTNLGRALTAVAERPRAAAALGWSPDLLASVCWGTGAALAGAAGILIAPLLGLEGSSMTLLVIVALAAGILGGFSSYPLTLLGGLAIGIAQSEITAHVSLQGAADSVPFLAVILVLLVRGKALPTRAHVVERLPGLGTGKVRYEVVVPVVVLFGVLIATVFGADLIAALTVQMVAAIILLSLVVLTGYAGQLSLAQFALAGIGAYIAGRLAATQGWDLFPATIVGVLGATLVGTAFALPALRTRGVTLAVVTLGLGIAVQSMLFENQDLTGGINGTNVGEAHILGINIDATAHPERYGIFCLVILALTAFLVANVRRSRAGRRLVAIRTNERAAASLGVSVTGSKLFAFGLSAGIAALGGILLAFQTQSIIYAYSFAPLASINALGGAVIGGVGYVAGPLVGGGFVPGSLGSFALDKIGNLGDWLTVIGGVSVILTLLSYPDGVVGDIVRLLQRPAERRRERRGERIPSDLRTEPNGSGGPVPTPVRVREMTLEVTDLTVRFGGVTAVDGVSLTIRPGEVLGLIGPNGAGKTTVIDALTGFVKARHATIILGGERAEGWSVHRRARAGLCRSFQSLELFEDLSVAENLRAASDPRDALGYFTSLLPSRERGISAAAAAAIAEFELGPDLHRLPSALPYGRRRLVGIARAVATEPSVLLLDEPAAGLDDVESQELTHLIRRLADEWGMAILLVEHDMRLVMETCDRVAVLDFGKKLSEGSPDEVRTDPEVVAAYLG